jgi:hypothetical protein
VNCPSFSTCRTHSLPFGKWYWETTCCLCFLLEISSKIHTKNILETKWFSFHNPTTTWSPILKFLFYFWNLEIVFHIICDVQCTRFFKVENFIPILVHNWNFPKNHHIPFIAQLDFLKKENYFHSWSFSKGKNHTHSICTIEFLLLKKIYV